MRETVPHLHLRVKNVMRRASETAVRHPSEAGLVFYPGWLATWLVGHNAVGGPREVVDIKEQH